MQSVECPLNYSKIENKEDCEAAITKIGGYKLKVWEKTNRKLPSGCVYSGPDVNFNSDENNTTDFSGYPGWGTKFGAVCKYDQ